MTQTPETSTIQSLRNFDKPPLVEVVFGVQFQSLERLLAPHIGAFWQAIRQEYPRCQEHPPLSPSIEGFGQRVIQNIQFTNVPPLPRTWFVSENETGVVQVQRDRFLHNWRKVKASDDYPRYNQVIDPFLKSLDSFEAFVTESGLGRLEHNQYELTYVNRLAQGNGWESLSSIGKTFPDICWRQDTERFLPVPEGINWKSVFSLPDQTGRLHVSLRSAKQEPDEMALFLELTARGFPSNGRSEMRKWFDEAHRWIVLGFEDLTTESVRKSTWGQK